jgi:UDPglucose 6-dehydrogenase
MQELLAEPVIFDGRNLWEPERLSSEGFHYVSVGRPTVAPAAQVSSEAAVAAATVAS